MKTNTIIIKNWRQVEGIRKSCKLAAQTLQYIAPFVKVGVTTLFLNDEIEKFIVKNGAIPAPLNYKGYPKATCISVNEVICHGIPGNYILKNGDILNIDVTTILDGYYGDTSTMFAIGDISEEAKHILNVSKDCLNVGIAQAKPGNYLGNIGYEINNYATKKGCSVVHQFCGHGVGLEFHESPQISHVAPKNSGLKMRHGMIFTIEPMINLGVAEALINEIDGWTATTKDGKLSAQYEHTVLITRTGVEILTQL